MSDLTLREAGDSDLPAVLGVLHAAFDEYREWLDPPSGVHRETLESLREYREHGCVMLALISGAVVGCVLFHATADHVYFGRLAVLPAFRNRGIASALVDGVEDRARDL